MATMDIFESDAFSVIELTRALENIPFKPALLSSSNLFSPRGVRSRTVVIESRDGTLSRRLKDNPGQMRGKTGTLNGVHTLAGFVDADDGTRYAYAFLINNVPGSLWPVKGVQDDFLPKLMTLSRR